MEPVRQLRRAAALTQQALAECGGTSQATIASYEGGRKSPTLRTLGTLAERAGLEMVVHFVPPLTREDRRSLAYHAAIAGALARDDVTMRKRARRTLRRLREQHPHASALLEQWRAWLQLPTDELQSRLQDRGMFARDMRQVSPFAGQLDAAARAQVLRELRAEAER